MSRAETISRRRRYALEIRRRHSRVATRDILETREMSRRFLENVWNPRHSRESVETFSGDCVETSPSRYRDSSKGVPRAPGNSSETFSSSTRVAWEPPARQARDILETGGAVSEQNWMGRRTGIRTRTFRFRSLSDDWRRRPLGQSDIRRPLVVASRHKARSGAAPPKVVFGSLKTCCLCIYQVLQSYKLTAKPIHIYFWPQIY